jgi:hypothetical protein
VLDDADGPVSPGDHVTAYESESRLEWPARVVVVQRGFVYLRPEWSQGRETV